MARDDPYGQPSPAASGTARTNTPSGTSFSTQVQNPSSTQTGAADPNANKAAFEALATAKIQQMIGTRYYLVDSATLQGIVDKLWQSVSLQQLMNGYQQSPSQYGAALETAIQNAILNPSTDPAIDPSVTSDYINAKQGAGESLSTAELTALSNATQAANAPVPRPFDTSNVSGYDFNTPLPPDLAKSTGQTTNMGTDYGTPAGSRIVSPFAGTVTVKHDPFRGNQVLVTLDNGWQISFGHVASAAATEGARVNPGDLIAISGSNVGDAQGAVTLVEWFDPQGNRHDPHQVLDPIFNGTTYSTLGLPGAAGTGSPTVNAVLDREYPSIKSDWTAMFGSPPSPEDVYNVLQHGTSPTQWTDFIRGMPGHIPGMTVGSIYDLRTVVDNVSMTSLGHAGTDGIVKELNDAGMTSQAQVKLWYDEHSPNEIDKTTYDDIVKVLKPNLDGALNESGVDPRMVKTIHDSVQGHPGPQIG
jgi:murein DD-endopeptidase MepM/ murein hydrolase activator NlpD